MFLIAVPMTQWKGSYFRVSVILFILTDSIDSVHRMLGTLCFMIGALQVANFRIREGY
jgi:hypothetical protein